MASSQVEISSSSPFGCVLRDCNRSDRCNRESNARVAAAFQKNLKELVRDHLHTCISVSSASAPNENTMDENNKFDSHHPGTHGKGTRINSNGRSLNMSRKQARNLDQWAARQARDIVSTIESQREEARIRIPPSGASSTQKTSPNSATSSGSGNLGASSLVQIWEARLNQSGPQLHRSSSMNNPQNSVRGASRTSSASSSNETALEEALGDSDTAESPIKEDSIADWDSQTPVEPSSAWCRSSDGERERVRIGDIIRRLISEAKDQDQHCNGMGEGLPRLRRQGVGSEQVEQKVLSRLVHSPKLRGRQAFNDLLLRMEQERQREIELLRERQAVSKFNHRGRIQSMLRLRFLQRGLAFQDQQRPRSSRSTASVETSQSYGSTIMHLRERFDGRVEQPTITASERAIPRSTTKIKNSCINTSDSASALNQLTQDSPPQHLTIPEPQSANPIDTSESPKGNDQEDFQVDSIASTDVTWQEPSMEVEDFHPQGTVLEVENFHLQGTSEATPSWNDWDGNEMEEGIDSEQYFEETNYDWFSDIARPRSYWEDRRQAWYQEKLSTSSDHDEIRQLIERRTVSSFLASDMRERIDQLMVSHAQRQVHEEELEESSEVGMEQLMLSYFGRHLHPGSNQEEEQVVRDGGEAEEEQVSREDGESPTSPQYLEATDIFFPSLPSVHSPTTFRSRNYGHDHGMSADSEPISNTPPSPTLPSQGSSRNDRRSSPPTGYSSFEIGLMYDLKGHMEQLQHEMFELRRSIQTCIEMQVNMQKSMKQEIHQSEGDGKCLLDSTRRKRGCCICCEKQVDSFLYRCGHMCTCLNCARELQESRGVCPVCGAPILDVVRACVD